MPSSAMSNSRQTREDGLRLEREGWVVRRFNRGTSVLGWWLQRGISGPNVGSLIINVRQLVRGGWSGFRVVCMRLYHRADDSQITRRNFHGLLPEKNVMSGRERHQCGQFQDQRQDEEKVWIHIRDIPGPDLYPRNFWTVNPDQYETEHL